MSDTTRDLTKSEEASIDGSTITDATYIRKISNQAEMDEKPTEKVEHLKQWLVGFGEQNKAHVEKHSVKHPYPKSRSRCTGARTDHDGPKETNYDIVDDNKATITNRGDEGPIGTKDNETGIHDGDDDPIITEESATGIGIIHDEPKENEPFASTPAQEYTKTISKQAETNERPLESVSELKPWLLRSGRRENTERCERKLVNELSKRMTREEAVKTAKNYMRKISDQAVCDELPLLHVAEAKQFLMDFEKKNKEHFEKHSIKHPNKRLSRCRVAKDEGEDENPEAFEGEASEKHVKDLSALLEEKSGVDLGKTAEAEAEPEAQAHDAAGNDEEALTEDDRTVEAKNEAMELIKEVEHDYEQTAEAKEETLEEVKDVEQVEEETTTEEDEKEMDDTTVDKEEAEGDDKVYGDKAPPQATAFEGKIEVQSDCFGGGKLHDLDEDSRISEQEEEQPLIEASNASDVFRKRYLVDEDEEDTEESERPKKMRRGLGLLKKLGCPVHVFGNKTNQLDVGTKAGLTTDPIVTMSSSADEDLLKVPGRAPPQVENFVGRGAAPRCQDAHHALLSPNSDITMNDFQEKNSRPTDVANEVRCLYEERLTKYARSPASSTDSGSTDAIPTETMLAKAGIKAGDDVAASHLKWLENKFNVDEKQQVSNNDLHEF